MPNYNKDLVPRSRELRKKATRQENHLWYDYLRTYPVRCWRQKVIGSYIADFCCIQAKLIIELDGMHHLEQSRMEYDAERTKYLEACGYQVVRFSNKSIDTQFALICEQINREIQQRIHM